MSNEFIKSANATERAAALIKILQDPAWGWQRFKSANDLLELLRNQQSDQKMLNGLEQIFNEAIALDAIEKNPSGNGSWYFYFYDCGLALHCEALSIRLGESFPKKKSVQS